MTRTLRLSFLGFLVTTLTIAQQSHTLSGSIQDGAGEMLPFANVLLMKASDSTLVKGALTSENGSYRLTDIPSGNYYVQGSFVGYQSAFSDPFKLQDDLELPILTLLEGEALKEVVVQARKPLFTQKVDRLVINVENSIVSSGGTALEVLERSPGVVVNRQNNAISVVGKDGVVVMINGKMSYVPTASLVQMLDGMNADNIESIELITTPPANFDAEGNAGYIQVTES